MDIPALESFVAVAETGSYAQAARIQGLTASAVAARVKALEQALGVALVRRSGRSVQATDSGMRILAGSRTLLRNARDLHALATSNAQPGEFRLGCFNSALTNMLPAILRRLYDQASDMPIYVSPGASVGLCHRVARGELDAAIVIEPQFPMPKNCVWQPFLEEPLVVIVPRRLADADAHQVLLREPFLRYDRHVYGGQLADRYLRDHGLHPRQRLEIDSLHAIAAMVHEGIGVSLIPDWSAFWQTLDIVRLPLPTRTAVRRTGLIWNRQGHHDRTAQATLACAVAAFNPPQAAVSGSRNRRPGPPA